MLNRDNMITKITIYRLDVPLIKPYKLSYNTFNSFEPLLIHIVDDQGNEGWGEQHISPGSSSETREGGWTFTRVISKLILNKNLYDAKEIILSHSSISIVASSAIYTAIEMLENNDVLNNKSSLKLKLCYKNILRTKKLFDQYHFFGANKFSRFNRIKINASGY